MNADEERSEPDEGPRVEIYPPTLHDPKGDAIAAFLFAGGWVGATVVGGLLASAAAGFLVAGGALLAGAGTIVYPWQRLRVHDLALRRRLARARRAASEAVPIAGAGEGFSHVRGRVHVLRAVNDPEGRPCAAYVRRARIRTGCTCTALCRVRYDALRTEWRCGRFAVVDDSGVAVVDGARVELWSREAGGPVARDGTLTLHHGDDVHLFGWAAKAEAQDASQFAPATYRDRALPLAFDGRTPGSAESPTLVLL